MQHRILSVALLLLHTTSVYAQSLHSIIKTPLGAQEACDSILSVGLVPASVSDGPPKFSQGSVDLIVSSISAELSPSASRNVTTNLSHAILDKQNNKATVKEEKKHVGPSLKLLTLLPRSEQSVNTRLASPTHHVIPTGPNPKPKVNDDKPFANPYNWCHSTLTLVQASLVTFLIGAVSVSVFYSLVAWYAVLNICRRKLLKMGALHSIIQKGR